MTDPPAGDNDATPWRALIGVMLGRRSRRFGLGMQMVSGPMAYTSRRKGLPLSEEEEALLVFSGNGITGRALGDLLYGRGDGGTIMAGLAGRTVPSGDAIQSCALIVGNREATYYVKRPQDHSPEETTELIGLARREAWTELYRRTRVRIADGLRPPPLEPFFNIDCNRWSLYDDAGTYFLPVSDLTVLYINSLLEVLNEHHGMYPLDERRCFLPAGVKRFARRNGGHLVDDTRAERSITIQQLETLVTEFATAEAGMVVQNIGLMTQALGLGGFPHWAAHPYGWFRNLGFRMKDADATRYLGMNAMLRFFVRALGRDQTVQYVSGLELDGDVLLAPHCPPWYTTMADAVRDVVETKCGPTGIFRGGARHGVWSDPDGVRRAAADISDAAIDATIAYCEYVHARYGRFPAYQPPLRTLLGFQVNHVDVEFYDRFYRAEALTDLQRDHMRRWHEDV